LKGRVPARPVARSAILQAANESAASALTLAGDPA